MKLKLTFSAHFSRLAIYCLKAGNKHYKLTSLSIPFTSKSSFQILICTVVYTHTHIHIHTHTNTHTHIYCIYYLPYSTCIVLFAISNPSVLSALHLKTSPLLASVIVIVETFPLVESGDPLRNH